jgi:WD40 repeat protein
MAKGNKKWLYILGLAVLIIYIFVTPRSIPVETVLAPRWITSLESNYPVNMTDISADENEPLLPFTLGNRFGYLADDGKFAFNQIQIKDGYVSMSKNSWAEYEALPSSIRVMNPHNEEIFVIENPKGYPLFLDNRSFIVGSEQNCITALNADGEDLWTHDFPAPLTCIDAAGGHLLAGTLDGTVELLDSNGNMVFILF